MPVIALDLGGTKLASALISDDGDILFTEAQPLLKRIQTVQVRDTAKFKSRKVAQYIIKLQVKC